MKLRMLFDVDGIFADFVSACLPWINGYMGTNHQHDDVSQCDIGEALSVPKVTMDKVYEKIKSPGACRNIPMYKGAEKGFTRLLEFVDPYFVTTPMRSSHWTFERERWLERWLGVDYRTIVHAYDKSVVAGHILLEDKEVNLREWRTCHPDGYPLLWECPANRSCGWDGRRVTSWDQLYQVVSDLYREIDVTKPRTWRVNPRN